MNDNFWIRTSPFGETIGTSVNSMDSLSEMVPRPERTAAFSSVEADETSFFSKWPASTSSMTSRREDTRAVCPASCEISLYENMTRPKASDEERSIRRFVTKPLRVSKDNGIGG